MMEALYVYSLNDKTHTLVCTKQISPWFKWHLISLFQLVWYNKCHNSWNVTCTAPVLQLWIACSHCDSIVRHTTTHAHQLPPAHKECVFTAAVEEMCAIIRPHTHLHWCSETCSIFAEYHTRASVSLTSSLPRSLCLPHLHGVLL